MATGPQPVEELMHARKIAIFVAVLGLGLAGVASVQAQQPGAPLHLKARLGERVQGQPAPGGKAHWVGTREAGRGMSVSVAGLDLPAGTVMQVRACGQPLGSFELRAGRMEGHTAGRLRLSARRGDSVPSCRPGAEVFVEGPNFQMQGALQPGRGRK